MDKDLDFYVVFKMDTMENFDFNELRISSNEIKEYDALNHIHLISQALLRSEGRSVLSIREASQRLWLMEGCTI